MGRQEPLVPSPTLEPQVRPASQAPICPLSLAGQGARPVHVGLKSPSGALVLWSPRPRAGPPVVTVRQSHPKPDLEAPDPGLRLPLALGEPCPSCLGNGNCHPPGPINYRNVTRAGQKAEPPSARVPPPLPDLLAPRPPPASWVCSLPPYTLLPTFLGMGRAWKQIRDSLNLRTSFC